MKTICLVFSFIISCVAFTSANPLAYGYGYDRPRRAMMFSGFYGNQGLPTYHQMHHQGAMSAFANRDMVATNSFAGEEYPPIQFPDATETTDGSVIEEELELDVITTTIKPKKTRKRKPTTPRPQLEEDEEDDAQEEQTPFSRRGQSGPGYNNFFPILFGGNGGIARNGEGAGHPGAAVAIANSFSTGKGGVASSHATAYGDPYFSTLSRRNNKPNNNNNNKHNNHKQY